MASKALKRLLVTDHSPEEASRTYWNKVSDWYIQYNYQNSNKIYRAMAPFLKLQTAQKVIDAGCGMGNSLPILRQFSSPNTQFTLVDISDNLIEIARNKISDAKILRENAEQLSSSSNQFDVYVSNGLIEIVSNPRQTLTQAFRVLKPGGTLGFSIYGRMGICNTLRLYKVIRNRLKPAKIYSEPRFQLAEPLKVSQLCQSVGFVDLKHFYKQYHFPQLSVEEIYRMYWDNPVLYQTAKEEGKLEELRKIIDEELENLLYSKEEPLIYEALVMYGRKPN